MGQHNQDNNDANNRKPFITAKKLLWIFIGVPFFVALIMDLANKSAVNQDDSKRKAVNETAFAKPEELAGYTKQCENAFIQAEHIKDHIEHTITSSKYYEIPPENPWHFQMDGSDIAISGKMKIRNLVYKTGHQTQEKYFYCGIDRATKKINYLNFIGYEKDIAKLGKKGIQRRPIKKTIAMINFEKKQKLDAEKEYTSLLIANCQRFIKTTYPQATIKLWTGKTVSPKLNKRGNWIMAFSWEATNSFGVDVHNRTWCEYDGKNGDRIANETETLSFEK